MKYLTQLLLIASLISAGCSTGNQEATNAAHLGHLQYAMQTDPGAEARNEYLAALESAIGAAELEGRRVPPGRHAELGYLLARQSRAEEARAQFLKERELYPESAVYIDRLLGESTGAQQPAAPDWPRVVVVLPPVNNSQTAEAKGILMASLADPLIQAGYYVLPVPIVMDVLQSEGLLDTRMYMDGTMKGFRDAFGADAVLISEILEWEKTFAGEASELTIDLKASLKSTVNDEILWGGEGKVRADLMTSTLAGASMEDVLYQSRVLELSTIATDYWDYVGKANDRMFRSLPPGPYAGNP